MSDFQYKSLLEQKKMTMNELQEYFRLLRKVEYERQTLYDMKIRKRIYFLIKLLLKINRLLEQRFIKVIKDQHYQTARGKIFVCTSSSDYDVPNMVEIVNELSWTAKEGNISDCNKSLELLLRTNLLTLFDSANKDDFRAIQNRLRRNLSTGGTEICFPELVGLRDEKTLVAALDKDFIRRTIDGKASLIPVALLETNKGKKGTIINIGRNLELGNVKAELYDDIAKIVRKELETLKSDLVEYDVKVLRKRR